MVKSKLDPASVIVANPNRDNSTHTPITSYKPARTPGAGTTARRSKRFRRNSRIVSPYNVFGRPPDPSGPLLHVRPHCRVTKQLLRPSPAVSWRAPAAHNP